MAAIAISPPRKLPVWQTVGASYAMVAHNFGQLARILWLWLLLMVPVYVATDWLHQAIPTTSGGQSAFAWVRAVAGALPVTIELPFLASIAVAWHRLVLRQERITRPAYLRLDGVVWRYAVYSFAFLLLPRAVPVICLSLVPSLADAVLPDAVASMPVDIFSAEPFIVLVMAIVLLLLPRLALVLPAVALGERLSLRHAWRVTRANTLRLGLATFVCMLPALSVAMLAPVLRLVVTAASWLPLSLKQTMSYIEATDPAREFLHAVSGSLGYAISASLAYVCLSTFAVALLSLTYRFFVVPGNAGEPAAA